MGKGRQDASAGMPAPLPLSPMVIDPDLADLTEGERAQIEADAERARREKQHYAQMLQDHGYSNLRQLYIDLVGSLSLEDPAGGRALQKYAEEAQDRLDEWSLVVLSVEEAVSRLGRGHQAVLLSTPTGIAIFPRAGETIGQMLAKYEAIRDRAADDLQNAWSEAFKQIETLDIIEGMLENILDLPYIGFPVENTTTPPNLPFDNEDIIKDPGTRISWWGRIGPWILNRDHELLVSGGKYDKQTNRIAKIKSIMIGEMESSVRSMSKSDLSNSAFSEIGTYLVEKFGDVTVFRRELEKFDSKKLYALKSKKSLKALAVRKELVNWNS